MTTTTFSPPLRGREAELTRFRRALEFGGGGGCALLAVEAPPGFGKTRFLDECVAAAERCGFVIGHGSPGARGPRLIVIDDAHLLGEEASDALLAERHARYGSEVVWLVARRSGMGSRALDALVSSSIGHHERITLDALGPAAASEVAVDILGVPPSGPLARVLGRAGGHPRLLVELLEGMREEGTLLVGAHEASLVAERIPQRLRVLLRSLLQDYPDQCRQLVRVAAVLGREITVGELLPILHVSPSALLLSLDEAFATGALTVDSARIGFHNELLWRLIVDSVPVTLRQALRQQARSPQDPVIPEQARGVPDLNGQENRIVQLIAEGMTNKQIARRLEISPHTVNYHLKKLFRKAGVNSRIALLREVRLEGSPR